MKLTTVALIVLLSNINALVALIGVALGGLLVYRTKREPHEGLFMSPEKPSSAIAKGEDENEPAYNPFMPQEEESESDDDLALGADVMKRNSEFLNTYNQHPQFVGGESSQGEKGDSQGER